MTSEQQATWDKMNKGFMTPYIYEAKDTTEAESIVGLEAGLDLDKGFYCRLSANGFLDCTDWSGPFETLELAQGNLIEMYGDDYE